MVKTPNWHKADQFAIYRHGSGIELMTTESNTSQWSERYLKPRPSDFKSSAPTTRPPSYLIRFSQKKSWNQPIRKQDKCVNNGCISYCHLPWLTKCSTITIKSKMMHLWQDDHFLGKTVRRGSEQACFFCYGMSTYDCL